MRLPSLDVYAFLFDIIPYQFSYFFFKLNSIEVSFDQSDESIRMQGQLLVSTCWIKFAFGLF